MGEECGGEGGKGWSGDGEGSVGREGMGGRDMGWQRGVEGERCCEWVKGCGGWDVSGGQPGDGARDGVCVVGGIRWDGMGHSCMLHESC